MKSRSKRGRIYGVVVIILPVFILSYCALRRQVDIELTEQPQRMVTDQQVRYAGTVIGVNPRLTVNGKAVDIVTNGGEQTFQTVLYLERGTNDVIFELTADSEGCKYKDLLITVRDEVIVLREWDYLKYIQSEVEPSDRKNYEKAVELYDSGKYERAISKLENISDLTAYSVMAREMKAEIRERMDYEAQVSNDS